MVVNLKAGKGDISDMVGLFGVPEELCAKAIALGVTVAQPTVGTFIVSSCSGEQAGVVMVKGQALSLAKAGTLGPVSKQALKFQFQAAFEKAVALSEGAGGGANEVSPPPQPTKISPSELTFYSVYSGSGNEPNHSSFKEGAPVEVEGYINGGKKLVKLCDATELGQGVFGTSEGSVYLVAAFFKGCAMAIRVSASKLSVRLEGGGLDKYKERLVSLGLEVKGKGEHISCHYNIAKTDVDLMVKTLGAIIASMGFRNLTSVTDLKKLVLV